MSEYADFERLIDNARIRLPGALDGVIKMELFTVLREFTEQSNAWLDRVTFLFPPGAERIELVPNHEADINRLVSVAVVGPDGSEEAYWTRLPAAMPEPGVVHIPSRFTSTAETQTCLATVALIVADPTGEDGLPTFPRWMADKYFGCLLDGTLYRMMSQPAKPYSSTPGALFHGRRFRKGVAQARNETRHGNAYGGQRWVFPQQFATYKRQW